MASRVLARLRCLGGAVTGKDAMTSGTGTGQDNANRRETVSDRVQGALVVACGAAMMMGLAVAAMTMLTSQDSWVMKATQQAMQDQQQAVATSYLINHGE